MKKLLPVLLLILALFGCNAKDKLELLLDDPDRETIDVGRLGLNAFFNESAFGTVAEQQNDVRNNLSINKLRVLMSWNDTIQPSRGAAPNFNLYDEIVETTPSGTELLVILTDTPTWARATADPIETFVTEWVQTVASRYRNSNVVQAYEIWNEPNELNSVHTTGLGITNPDVYMRLLQRASTSIRAISPNKLIVGPATTAINQNYPDTLNYNRRLRDLGAENYIDIWSIHYYGKQFENFIRSGGVEDFLNSISKTIWVTESGERGVMSQLAYAETVFPFLLDNVNNLERIYYYQYTNGQDASSNTYALRNSDPNFSVSDLYVHLRDR